MRRFGQGLALGVSLAAVALACGASRLPAPPYVAHPTSALQEVAYPPPPARVEYVPPLPRDGAVWIDGEWTWQGERWAWKRGRWVMPPASAAYSPWTTSRDRSGNLYLAEGKWRDRELRELPDPPPLAVSATRGGAVTNAEGERVPVTQNVPLNARTEPTAPTAPILPEPDASEPSDAGFADVVLDDAMSAPDAVPLGTRMIP